MENLFGTIVNYVFGGMGILIAFGILIRLAYSFFSKEKQEKAVVINKQSFDKQVYRKNQASFVRKEYVITFQCGKKKRHFSVSELSYGTYRMHEKGTLRYKGNRLIDFK